MTPSVVWTTRAEVEAREAYEWWATNQSQAEATSWHVALRETIERLPTSPRSHPFAHDLNDEVEFEVRVVLFGIGRTTTHRVVYAIEDDSVTILSIRHVAQRDLTSEDLT